MSADARVVAWDDIPADEVFPGIFRQMLVSEEATIIRYVYRPGCVFPAHQHPDEQVTIVHTGAIEFTVGREIVVLRAGQVAIIPGDVPHGARVLGNEVVVTDNYIASANRAPLTFAPSESS